MRVARHGAGEPRSLWNILFAGACRFLLSALFGGMISLLIIFAVMYLGIYSFWSGHWWHVIWLIPVSWGILGIFVFDSMLTIARNIVESIFE